MYFYTGITPPNINSEALAQASSAYATFGKAVKEALQSLNSAVSMVSQHNSGTAYQAFLAQVSGSGSISSHLVQLAGAASRTSAAYATANTVGTETINAMNAIASARSEQLMRIRWSSDPQRGVLAANLVTQTREDLKVLLTAGVTAINEAFATVNLPTTFSIPYGDRYGRDDPRVVEDWGKLSDDEKKEIPQKMADEYADEHDLERIEIKWKNPGPFSGLEENTSGYYRHVPRAVVLNESKLNGTHLLHTVVHEMEHYYQFNGMSKMPWVDTQMSEAERNRWRELNQGYVRNRGGDDDYIARPIEVGARQTGREHRNNLSWEDYLQYKER